MATALSVRHRDLQHLTALAGLTEGGIDALGQETGPLTAVLQMPVAAQHPGQQPGLAQDLEAVADPDDRTALGDKLVQRRHYRREPGDGPSPQIITIGEAARQHQAVVGG